MPYNTCSTTHERLHVSLNLRDENLGNVKIEQYIHNNIPGASLMYRVKLC